MRWLKGLAKFLGIIYLLLCMALFFDQERIIFRPDKLSENYQFRTGEEVEISVANGIDLNCLWLKEPASQGVILFWHGNRGSNRRCLRQAQRMSGNGYDIFMPDYRGFGKSDGQMRSGKQMLADAQGVYDWLKERYREDQIVVVGYSLGTGPATYLASQNDPSRLLLLAPYQSMAFLKNRIAPFIPDFLLKYPLRSIEYMEEVDCPVTLFHGTADEVIPYENSVALQQVDPARIELVRLEREGHRGTIFNSLFQRRVTQLLHP